MKQEMIPLLRKGVEWAEAEYKKPWIDRRWWQNQYQTTARELAAAMLTRMGVRHVIPIKQQMQVAANCGTCYCMAGWLGQELDPRYAFREVVDDVHVAAFVREQMGFTPDEAGRLFDGSNSITAVRRISEEIAGEPL